MLIVATRSVNDYQVEVVVLDESSSAHTDDTRLIRKDGKPVPFTDAAEQNINDAFVAFYCDDGVNHTLEYLISIGRGEIYNKKDWFIMGLNHNEPFLIYSETLVNS